jgi:hypothetical protein
MLKFIMKWIINGAVVALMLVYFADVPFIEAAITATAITVIAYVVGDQIILRASNNAIATLADFGLGFLILWVASDSMSWDINLGEIFTISILLAVAEWVVHRYILKPKLKVPSV